ncbi:MAG: hypothetical protein V1750_00580, partial [Acidobacteriota bacterium]
ARSDNPFIDYSRRDQLRTSWLGISFILWYELFFNRNLDLFRAIENLALQGCDNTHSGYQPLFLQQRIG